MVTTDFIDHGERGGGRVERGGVDLGGVLATKAVVARLGRVHRLAAAARGGAGDARQRLVVLHRALELGATTAIVQQFLFFHN